MRPLPPGSVAAARGFRGPVSACAEAVRASVVTARARHQWLYGFALRSRLQPGAGAGWDGHAHGTNRGSVTRVDPGQSTGIVYARRTGIGVAVCHRWGHGTEC